MMNSRKGTGFQPSALSAATSSVAGHSNPGFVPIYGLNHIINTLAGSGLAWSHSGYVLHSRHFSSNDPMTPLKSRRAPGLTTP